MLEAVGKQIRTKLVSVLGDLRAQELVEEVLGEMGVSKLETPEHRLDFGRRLVKRGGLYAVLGHSIQTQAILHGARLLPEAS